MFGLNGLSEFVNTMYMLVSIVFFMGKSFIVDFYSNLSLF